MRPSGRAPDQMRSIAIEPAYTRHAEGSCLISFGETRVLCTASVENQLPPWLRGKGKGWVTAEYGMLPRATHTRGRREAASGKQSGRTQEIQRLIGRSLRAVTDLKALGERQITLDCDVIQADGGTRTAAVTGGYVALSLALESVLGESALDVLTPIAAVSVGIVRGVPMLDLDYDEDASADVDLNVIRNSNGEYVEVQATAERAAFSRTVLGEMLELADKGIDELLLLLHDCIQAAQRP